MRRRYRKKIKSFIITATIAGATIALSSSLVNILSWNKDNAKTSIQLDDIQNSQIVQEVKDTKSTEIIKQSTIDKSNPYWDYIKMNLIDVDFSALKKINPDVSGWIQVNGTNINYPYVLTTDNNYYLSHSLDKSYNTAGWAFLDKRNEANLSHKNNIIYAHGRLDGTMFGTLKNILTSEWITDTNNYVIKLSTETENTLWQIFSVYRIPTTTDYLQINFKDNNEFLTFANMLLERSNYDFNTTINATDKILTLSTCYNDEEKVVLHAKLIKKTTK